MVSGSIFDRSTFDGGVVIYNTDTLIGSTIHPKHTTNPSSYHTQQHAAYDPARSGAEWWVQVLDEDDDIGERGRGYDVCMCMCIYI